MNSKIILFFTLSSIFTFVGCAKLGAIDFSDCPPEYEVDGILSNLIIPDCKQPPCMFKKGETYRVEIDFENTWNTTTLTSNVFGVIGNVPVRWPDMDLSGCDNLIIGTCPLYEYDYVTYAIDLFVEPTYPTIDVTLRWLMEGDDGKGIFCWEIPVKVR